MTDYSRVSQYDTIGSMVGDNLVVEIFGIPMDYRHQCPVVIASMIVANSFRFF